MMVLVSYDVAEDDNGKKRLRNVARTCQNYGQRVQYSVFECLVDPAQWAQLRSKLEHIIDNRFDSLRYYYLGSNWQRKVEQVGAKQSYNVEGPIIV